MKPRKRRHRDAYYRDDNAESESESDSETEPAPPGEESVKSDAQERAAEESLHPPGVEPISSDEVMPSSKDRGEGIKNDGGETSDAVSSEKAVENGQEKLAGKSGSKQSGNEVTDVTSQDSSEAKVEVAESKTEEASGKSEVWLQNVSSYSNTIATPVYCYFSVW